MNLKTETLKLNVSAELKKECINYGIEYNEFDTNAQLCEKLNS